MKKEDKVLRKRLAVDVPTEIHNKLKYLALLRNCPMRKLVLRALITYIKYEDQFNQ